MNHLTDETYLVDVLTERMHMCIYVIAYFATTIDNCL